MEPEHAPSIDRRQPDPDGGSPRAGLALCDSARLLGLPRYLAGHLTGHVIEPVRTIGADTTASLKVSYWYSTVEDSPQSSDPSFVSASLRTSPARAWRNAAPSGLISMLPFEGAQWRFERPVSFVQFHLPFDLMTMICSAMFDSELTHDDLNMPADVRDTCLHGSMERIRHMACQIEPTNLLLDSWSLILGEALLRRLSTHGERDVRGSFGRIPARGIARVVDYIETGIDQDLRLTVLADIAGMSMYHFARRFRETVGISPHAYVLGRRIVRARTMLSRNEAPLSHVALACGFSSQAHLTSAFHRSLGVTPGVYRRQVR